MSNMPPETPPLAQPGGHFNILPYESHPIIDTQPSRLAALAVFYGLKPPPVASCRVLELGCASGGNLIPLAARFPKSQFLGIDLAPRHIAMARERIEALGLTNIDIRQGDLADTGLITGEFDYIVSHGVFSWVPKAAQDGMLNICNTHLARDGIAYISYNVLPGWQLRKVIRDFFLLDDDTSRSPADRVARGRWLLEQMAMGSNQSTPYGQLLRREARQLSAQSDSYVMSEFLAEENSPCYFHEFMARAEAAGMAFLTETELHTSMPAETEPQLNQLIRAMSGPDVKKFEQYYDLMRGRQFRKTLLVRQERAASIQRTPDAKRIAGLHFATRLRLAPEQKSSDALQLLGPGGITITTNDPVAAKALDHLGAAFPETRSLQQLLEQLGIAQAANHRIAADRIINTLLRMVIAGLCTFSATPVNVGRASDPKPRAWRVALHDGKFNGQPITNLNHHPVRLDAIGTALLPLLDGNHDRDMMAAHLDALIEDGKLDASALEQIDAGAGAARTAQWVDHALRQMEMAALLEPIK